MLVLFQSSAVGSDIRFTGFIYSASSVVRHLDSLGTLHVHTFSHRISPYLMPYLQLSSVVSNPHAPGEAAKPRCPVKTSDAVPTAPNSPGPTARTSEAELQGGDIVAFQVVILVWGCLGMFGGGLGEVWGDARDDVQPLCDPQAPAQFVLVLMSLVVGIFTSRRVSNPMKLMKEGKSAKLNKTIYSQSR